MPKQAERCSPNELWLHNRRRRKLGEKMIGDSDRVRVKDLVGSAVLIAALLAYGAYRNVAMPWSFLL